MVGSIQSAGAQHQALTAAKKTTPPPPPAQGDPDHDGDAGEVGNEAAEGASKVSAYA